MVVDKKYSEVTSIVDSTPRLTVTLCEFLNDWEINCMNRKKNESTYESPVNGKSVSNLILARSRLLSQVTPRKTRDTFLTKYKQVIWRFDLESKLEPAAR